MLVDMREVDDTHVECVPSSPDSPFLRPLEGHVLDQMTDAALRFFFVRAAHLHPHLDGGDLASMIFLYEDLKTVGKC